MYIYILSFQRERKFGRATPGVGSHYITLLHKETCRAKGWKNSNCGPGPKGFTHGRFTTIHQSEWSWLFMLTKHDFKCRGVMKSPINFLSSPPVVTTCNMFLAWWCCRHPPPPRFQSKFTNWFRFQDPHGLWHNPHVTLGKLLSFLNRNYRHFEDIPWYSHKKNTFRADLGGLVIIICPGNWVVCRNLLYQQQS